MKISIIGTGYVGLTTGACFAEVGHSVICVDNNPNIVKSLRKGKITIYEPRLEEIVKSNVALGRLTFTESKAQAIEASDVIFIAVPTPPQKDGSVDLSFVEVVAKEIAQVMKPGEYKVIVDKSTVPVTTGTRVTKTILAHGPEGVEFDVVSNPEFLREGSAVQDLLKPDRVVIGANSDRALKIMHEIYEPFDAPILETDLNSAEIIKHAANSFLAMKISFINAVSAICDRSDADVELVAKGIGMDERIGKSFLKAGLGYGGSCFPKDLKAFIAVAEELGVPFNMLREVETTNAAQLTRFMQTIRDSVGSLDGKKIGVLGIAFKSNTDDIRCSVAVELIRKLVAEQAEVLAYDPKASDVFRKHESDLASRIRIVDSIEDAAKDVDALVIATEWPAFANADYAELKKKMRAAKIFDGRNLLDPAHVLDEGFEYHCIGRAGAVLAAKRQQG